jgi:hypothetical protein
VKIAHEKAHERKKFSGELAGEMQRNAQCRAWAQKLNQERLERAELETMD